MTSSTTSDHRARGGKKSDGSIRRPIIAKAEAEAESEAAAHHDRSTMIWWATLCAISLFNIAVWLHSYRALLGPKVHDNDNDDYDDHHYRRHHLLLSGIYVFACAYRSFLPRIDLERYCLWDTPLSSIFLGRTAATIAEISFAGQISLFLHRLGTNNVHHDIHLHPLCIVLAYSIVPAITIAQCFCWCGVVTLNHVYHAIEESIWAILSLFVGLELASLVVVVCRHHPDDGGSSRSLFYLGVIGSLMCFAFFLFMVTVDVPMYVRRWREGRRGENDGGGGRRAGGETTTHRVLLRRMTTFEGGKDAICRRVVTKSWHIWREETLWLTGYFSSAVWLSLFLIHLQVPA